MKQLDELLSGKTLLFSIACYFGNSVDQLETLVNSSPNKNDMRIWGINEKQWRNAVFAALTVQRQDLRNLRRLSA